MRWERLFEDLEAQLTSDDAREIAAEVADRTRRERALVEVQARLLANIDAGPVSILIVGGALTGPLRGVGPDWLLIEPRLDRPTLVPLAAVQLITGLEPGAGQVSVVAKRFGLGPALRAISRDRAVVELTLTSGRALPGTIDVVGADYLELAAHPLDEPRRSGNVRAHQVVPFTALAAVRRV